MKLKIYSTDSRVDSFDVYANGVFKANVPITYAISTTVTNGSSSGDTSISKGGTAYVTLSAGTGYNLPSSITVTGATYTYDSSTGVVSLSAPTGDVSISAECVSSGYTVTIDNTNEYVGNIYDGADISGTAIGSGVGTYTITSGHITISSDRDMDLNSVGTVSGGVIYNDDLSVDRYAVYDVTGDGTISHGVFACFVEGTKITLADGSEKNVEDITYDDELLVWDFYEGKFGTAKPMWIAPEHTATYYYRVEIEGGTVLKLVGSNGKSHRLYDYEGKQFSYPQDMGRHHTIDKHYRGLHIENIERVDEEVKYYNIITDKHYNLYAEGILTSCRLSNRYGIAQPFSRTCSQMKYDTNDVRMTEEEVQAYIDALER